MQIILVRKKIISFSLIVLVLLLIGSFLHSYFQKDVQTIQPIYIGNTSEKAVALMVNVDWGEDLIPGLLKIMEEKKVTATFFITGRFAKKYPEIIRQIAAAGHEIGNHGYAHPHPDQLSLEQNKKELTDTENVFKDLQIAYAKIFASPYGEHGDNVLQAANELGYQVIMWTLDTVDWQNPSPGMILERILPRADNGSLILMHPKECTVQALPDLIDALQKDGFAFKKVSEIISGKLSHTK